MERKNKEEEPGKDSRGEKDRREPHRRLKILKRIGVKNTSSHTGMPRCKDPNVLHRRGLQGGKEARHLPHKKCFIDTRLK